MTMEDKKVGEVLAGMSKKESLKKELTSLINRYSLENGSDTPDYILAEYLILCLNVFEETVEKREHWYGRELSEAVVKII